MKKSLLILIAAVMMGACSQVTIRTDAGKETTKEPYYQQRFDYWWWGLKGEHDVNVREICFGRDVEQMQSVATFTDAVLGIITLGIYAPRSARVWCEEKQQ